MMEVAGKRCNSVKILTGQARRIPSCVMIATISNSKSRLATHVMGVSRSGQEGERPASSLLH